VRTTILLVRHGETDWNRALRWQGQSDPPLNETGREQARALAAKLDGTPIDAIYASDLRRAKETADVLAKSLRVPVVLEPRLREINAGSWEGLSADEIRERWPDAHSRFAATGEPGWENGETYQAMAARAADAVREIAARHPDGTVLVVSHGGPVKALLMAATGLEVATQRRELPAVGNCEVCRVVVDSGRLRGE
jgi:broad specificity phosphatase PhoE